MDHQAGPTPDELIQGFRSGGVEKVSQLMTVNGRRMVPSPEDLFLACQKGGNEMLGALMENMDGDEDGPDPAWNERRWR